MLTRLCFSVPVRRHVRHPPLRTHSSTHTHRCDASELVSLCDLLCAHRQISANTSVKTIEGARLTISHPFLKRKPPAHPAHPPFTVCTQATTPASTHIPLVSRIAHHTPHTSLTAHYLCLCAAPSPSSPSRRTSSSCATSCARATWRAATPSGWAGSRTVPQTRA